MATQQLQQEKLFVVVDPRDETHLALDRAMITSRLRRPAPEISVFVSCDDSASARDHRASLIRDLRWFDDIVREPLNGLLLKYNIAVSWGGSWPQELLESASEFKASTIMLPLHQPVGGQRPLLNNSKWELLKNAHCPVLLARPGASEKRRRVLAAVNFQATEDRQKALNERILGHAKRVANLYTADLHVVNAYLDTLHYPDRGRLVNDSGLSSNRIHVHQGYTNEIVADVVEDIGADMLVIGTLNQRGSTGSFRRGNTTTRILGAVDIDTLVVN